MSFDKIICVENLLLAFQEFKVGKKSKLDVLEFEDYLIANILSIHAELKIKVMCMVTTYLLKYVTPKKEVYIRQA